jgi:hypothetical protein
VYTRNVDSRRSYKSAVRAIKDAIAGAGGKTTKSRSEKLRRKFFGRYAESLFTDIHKGYLAKSTGSSDELGERWPPLQPATIAARPVTRADIQKWNIASNRQRGLLTPKENAVWRKIFKLKFDQLFWGNVTHDEAKRSAAKYAWWWLKRFGAKTKKETLGTRNVPILIDTGRLEKSFRPGRMAHWSYVKYNKDQIYEIHGQQMTIGSKVPYGKYHQEGTKHMPARPPIPAPKAMKRWTLRAARKASESIPDTLAEIL